MLRLPASVHRTILALVLSSLLSGCGDDDAAPSVDPGPDHYDCTGFVEPQRVELDRCDEPDADHPERLGRCERGSGQHGRWSVDADGLPAYDFAIEQRCDPIATAYSPRSTPLRDPIHLVGNGRGLVAMAHASGAVEIYSQDRGHKWINRVDLWQDPTEPTYPQQLGGGFSYYAVHQSDGSARVGSTRFDDLPTNRATDMQSRRFGVGYFETVTREADIVVRRRTFAPDSQARALVVEVTVENPTNRPLDYDLVELWDLNLHQLQLELITSDVSFPGTTERIDRRRRRLAAGFTHELSWNAERRIATSHTSAKSLPATVSDRDSTARLDSFPEPVFLAPLDVDASVDAVWLTDAELWPAGDRRPPQSIVAAGDANPRHLQIDGAGQSGLLAMRLPLRVAGKSQVVRRFAFGYVPGGGAADAVVDELRQQASELNRASAAAWRERLVWAAFPGLPQAGVIQRELAWAAYNALAHTTYDEYRGVRLLGQGGSYKYIHGMDGAMGDLALFADAVTLLDADLAADTLAYTLASQHGSGTAARGRYPYATTGVGEFTDVLIYNQRSDAYFFVPSSIGRYVGLTRDDDFLQREVAYWPRAAGDRGTVLEHLHTTLDYAEESLGIGARGIVAMGTGDYADGVLALATEATTPQGTSSTYNAGMVALGFPRAAAVLETHDAPLAGRLRQLAESQTTALVERAWSGDFFYRGFADSGNPLAPNLLFLEPQLFPVLAGAVDDERRDAALDAVVQVLETDLGAVSNVAIGETGPIGGPDQPLVGGIWPVANAWLTEAYARRDVDEGWSSFVRNTLAAHAQAHPNLWYGIWTGPDSFNGPQHPRPGEADAHPATALTDYPALNMHVHTSPLRAMMGLLGIEPTGQGIALTPRLPSATFSVHWPRLVLEQRPDFIGGSYVASSNGPIELDVALPSRLRNRSSVHADIAGVRTQVPTTAGRATITLPAIADTKVAWSLSD